MTSKDPFAGLPAVPTFGLQSTSFVDGATLGLDQCGGRFGVRGGKDISPQLSWTGAPAGTRSFTVTVHDPDAPGAGGFWHWAVADIPATVTSLPEGAGAEGGASLPSGARQLKNDGGFAGYLGAAPPPGHGVHRYVVRVHAVDVDSLGLPPGAAPARLAKALAVHVLGKASITGTFGR